MTAIAEQQSWYMHPAGKPGYAGRNLICAADQMKIVFCKHTVSVMIPNSYKETLEWKER